MPRRKPRYFQGGDVIPSSVASAVSSAGTESTHIFTTKAEDVTFASLGLHQRLVNALSKRVDKGGFGFERPTRIQQMTLMKTASGKDLLIKSETGSGKTLAYLLPIVQQLVADPSRPVDRRDGTRAIVLLPTRELCLQTFRTMERVLAAFHWIIPGVLVGGDKRKAEKARLRKGLSVLAATPGRLLDHLKNTEAFKVTRLNFLVLDEADRLLDMGFEPQVKEILSVLREKLCPPNRQNLLISATLDRGVRSLADYALKNCEVIDGDDEGNVAVTESKKKKKTGGEEKEEGEAKAVKEGATSTFKTPQQLAQHFVELSVKQRFCGLVGFLEQQCVAKPRGRIVVFVSCCDSVDYHHAMLKALLGKRKEKKAASSSSQLPPPTVLRLHGNMPRKERRETLERFCSSSSSSASSTNARGILVCTDVAARGLNIPDVDWIVQFDPPHEVREYVHRVGRTARSGKGGRSLLFVAPSEIAYINILSRHELALRQLSANAVLVGLVKDPEDRASRGKRRSKAIVAAMSRLQAKIEKIVEGGGDDDDDDDDDTTPMMKRAIQAFRSHTRAYAAHPKATKRLFRVRSLHFGHLAKSFGLKEPPSSFGEVLTTVARKNAKKGPAAWKEKREAEQNPEAFSTKEWFDAVRRGKQGHVVSEFAA